MSVYGWRVTTQQYLDWGMFRGMLRYRDMFHTHPAIDSEARFRVCFEVVFNCAGILALLTSWSFKRRISVCVVGIQTGNPLISNRFPPRSSQRPRHPQGKTYEFEEEPLD